MNKIPEALYISTYLILDGCPNWTEFLLVGMPNLDVDLPKKNIDNLVLMNILFWKYIYGTSAKDSPAQSSESYDFDHDLMNQPSTSNDQVKVALAARKTSIYKEMLGLAEQGSSGKGSSTRRQRFYELAIEMNQIKQQLAK